MANDNANQDLPLTDFDSEIDFEEMENLLLKELEDKFSELDLLKTSSSRRRFHQDSLIFL